MNLHQFRFVQEAVRHGLNLTEAARALHTSQPGVSKAILELEDELGVAIFARHGKRLRKVTEPGALVLKSIDLILREVNNLRRIGAHYRDESCGTLSIATTHTQARYVLPEPVARLRATFPQVNISLHQGSPLDVARMVRDETADLGIATESLADFDDLVSLPCYEWQHVAVMRANHPLRELTHISLQDLAREPLITYHPAYTGRARIDQAFASQGLAPQVVLEAIDSDVIRTYVSLGLGVGIAAEMAMREGPGVSLAGLIVRPLGHLFGRNTARVAFKRGAYLRQYVLQFAESLSPRLNRQLLLRALEGHADDYQL